MCRIGDRSGSLAAMRGREKSVLEHEFDLVGHLGVMALEPLLLDLLDGRPNSNHHFFHLRTHSRRPAGCRNCAAHGSGRQPRVAYLRRAELLMHGATHRRQHECPAPRHDHAHRAAHKQSRWIECTRYSRWCHTQWSPNHSAGASLTRAAATALWLVTPWRAGHTHRSHRFCHLPTSVSHALTCCSICAISRTPATVRRAPCRAAPRRSRRRVEPSERHATRAQRTMHRCGGESDCNP